METHHDTPPEPSVTTTTFSRRLSLTAGLSALGLGALTLAGCTGQAGDSPSGPALPPSGPANAGAWAQQMNGLEKSAGVTLSVCAFVDGGPRLEYRSAEAIPLCSTFKVIAVAALLDKHSRNESYWAQNINIDAAKLVNYSPITSPFVGKQMTVSALCDAALRFSDNTAGNLLLEQLGGPSAVTAFATSQGFNATRLDRTETDLNSAIPGDPRDTSTSADLAGLCHSFLLGDGLDTTGQTMLRGWMLRNTTSTQRMRAGLPTGAELADKTGSGDYGVINGAGVIFQRGKKPISLAIMTRTDQQDSPGKPELMAQVTESVVAVLNPTT